MFTKKTLAASEKTSRKSRLGKVGAAAATVAFAATALPMALAGPAQAGNNYGCEVKPLKPVVYYNGHGTHDDYVNYRIKVHCEDGYWIDLHDQQWEKDNGHDHDDYLATWTKRDYFDHEGTKTYSFNRKAPNTEHGHEEVYHRVTFKTYKHGHWTGWHNWKNSHVEKVYQY